MADNSFQIPRKIIIFAIVLPIAALLGYTLATPEAFTSVGFVGLLLIVLAFPVMLKWHHPLLILSWNASIQLWFLPGRPELWIIMAAISLLITILNRFMGKEMGPTFLPSVVWPLVFTGLVVIITAKYTGMGIRSLGGSTHGGRNYVLILMAILGYFAISSRVIEIPKAPSYALMFFLSATTAVISNLTFFAGPSFYFLFYLFPPTFALEQAYSEYAVSGDTITRLTGFAFAAPAMCYVMLLRYGIQGILVPSKIWRLVLFVFLAFLSTLGGFRSTLIMTGFLLAILFYFEGLFRTRLVLVALLVAVLGGAALVPLAKHLPAPVQRSISFLPVEVDQHAAFAAESSTEWRLRVWKILMPQIPQYFWFGKGYGMDPTELYLLQENILRYGWAFEPDMTIASGSYHNGPLTLIIPFGIWGILGFLWFSVAALRVLYRNYLYGPPELKMINTFLLSFFIMRWIYFMVFYGQFFQDFAVFTGITAFSISLNGGMCKAPDPFAQPELETAEAPLPELSRA